MPDYGIIKDGKLSVSKTRKDGYKPVEYAAMPAFDQASQCVVQGEVEDRDSSIYVGFLVREVEVGAGPTEPEDPAAEFIEHAPRNERGPAGEVELLRAQNKALSDRSDFIEELIFEMALQVYE